MTTWISRSPGGPQPGDGPLAGTRVGVKDNIDVAGFPTTAACPSFAYEPEKSATAVERLVAAGCEVVGKTNLDQFATGLVGTRSPYGVVENPVAPGFVSGGSSSGSAAAVAAGEVDVALGTDTAGSGRVPAAFCGVVGLKGTRGWVPSAGVVPACPSFDCTTVFASDVRTAVRAMEVVVGPDPEDPSSRTAPPAATAPRPVQVVGVPDEAALAGCDDRARRLFGSAVERMHDLGLRVAVVDLDPYFAAGSLLYDDAFVAERTAAVGDFLATEPPDADPTVAEIVAAGHRYAATDLAGAHVRRERYRVDAGRVFDRVDAVLLPTAPFHPTIDDVAADPIGINARLGRFVTGCNLVDWCAAAVPVPSDGGWPFGVQLLGPAWTDRAIWSLAAGFVGEADPVVDTRLRLAVAGAHLAGEPLNHQLTDRGATLVSRTTTAPVYRMVALDGPVPKPGLVRAADGGGPVEVEVWALDDAGFGSFVADVPPPLCIGTVELADGTSVPGFLCEPHAAADALDITATGGWRAWLAGGTPS